MSESIRRHHALRRFLDARSAAVDAGVHVTVQSALDFTSLRGDAGDPEFRTIVESVIGESLPLEANTSNGDRPCVYWLGPDEWLITAVADAHTASTLSANLSGQVAAINSQNGGLIQLDLTGEHTRAVLAEGCTLDLHPAVFRPGRCAQSGLAKTAALIALAADAETFRLIVRTSFAEYLARWLERASNDYGCAFAIAE